MWNRPTRVSVTVIQICMLLFLTGCGVSHDAKSGVIGFTPDGKTALVWSYQGLYFSGGPAEEIGLLFASTHGELGWMPTDDISKARSQPIPNFFPGLADNNRNLSFSPNGRKVGIRTCNGAFVLDLGSGDLQHLNPEDGELILTNLGWISDDEVSYAAVSMPDEPDEDNVKVYRQSLLKGHSDRKMVHSVVAHGISYKQWNVGRDHSCSPNGRFMVLLLGDDRRILLDVLSGEEHSLAPSNFRTCHAESGAWSPDSTKVLVSYFGENKEPELAPTMPSKMIHFVEVIQPQPFKFLAREQVGDLTSLSWSHWDSTRTRVTLGSFGQCVTIDLSPWKMTDLRPQIFKILPEPEFWDIYPSAVDGWVLVRTRTKLGDSPHGTYAIRENGEGCLKISEDTEAELSPDGKWVLEGTESGGFLTRRVELVSPPK